ncbi:MAG: TonB-dependent receptor [Alphaproteobacteria bacterium]|nr:TonB-dependent receptor [Alphaproteobacteria bacterium]
MIMRAFGAVGVFAALITHGPSAVAQRANENAVVMAEDAFGTQVGNESIGLYNAADVRGFSPTEAGNLHIEGLYFDRQGDHTNRIIASSTVRVGLSAQSYPFPAPTGIVDFSLRRPGEKPVTSAVFTYGPFDQAQLEVDTQLPISAEKLSVGAGAMAFLEKTPSHKSSGVWNVGSIARWRPTDNLEILPFGAINYRYGREGPPNILLAGPALPPVYPRHIYFGQDWADLSSEQSTLGMIARADLGNAWTLRTGVFRSLNFRTEQAENLFRNTRADGRTDREVVILQPNRLDSVSGEARLSHVTIDDDRRHTFHASLRARAKLRTFGGSATIPLGPGIIGVPDPEPQPNFSLGPISRSKVRQGTFGVAYEGLWRDVGELSLGVQKTKYRRRSFLPGLPTVTSKDDPWLYNGTIAANLSRDFVVYGSYTRGLEESGEAPQNAANRGEAVAATRTAQVDAGIRYALTPSVRLIAGVFDVKKPFFSQNAVNIFTQVGDVRHCGIEFSLSGRVAEGLTVVAGATLLKARVSGDSVARGVIGRIPLGRYPHSVKLTGQYGPPAWRGLAIDAQAERFAGRYIDVLNTAKIAPHTVIDVGGRYTFTVGGRRASLRLQLQNATDEFRWNVASSGTYIAILGRRFVGTLTADF